MTASTDEEKSVEFKAGWDAGHDDGYAQGWNEGFTAGKEQGEYCETCDDYH